MNRIPLWGRVTALGGVIVVLVPALLGTVSLSFTFAGLILISGSLVAQIRGHLEPYQTDGVAALGNTLCVIACVINETTAAGSLNAALAAWCGYRWWKGGGGDDTKRRLRSAWKPFVGVRRTAPQGAA